MSLRKFLYNYPLIAIFSVAWVMLIVTFATYHVFTDPQSVSASVASCYSALLGVPGVVYGFIEWRLGQEEKRKCKESES